MLDASELSDDISINSDDTDILLTATQNSHLDFDSVSFYGGTSNNTKDNGWCNLVDSDYTSGIYSDEYNERQKASDNTLATYDKTSPRQKYSPLISHDSYKNELSPSSKLSSPKTYTSPRQKYSPSISRDSYKNELSPSSKLSPPKTYTRHSFNRDKSPALKLSFESIANTITEISSPVKVSTNTSYIERLDMSRSPREIYNNSSTDSPTSYPRSLSTSYQNILSSSLPYLSTNRSKNSSNSSTLISSSKNLNEPFELNSTSYNRKNSPSKTVSFEETVDEYSTDADILPSMKSEEKRTQLIKSPQSKFKVSSQDQVDAKVKEGQEILKRLLYGNNDRNPTYKEIQSTGSHSVNDRHVSPVHQSSSYSSVSNITSLSNISSTNHSKLDPPHQSNGKLINNFSDGLLNNYDLEANLNSNTDNHSLESRGSSESSEIFPLETQLSQRNGIEKEFDVNYNSNAPYHSKSTNPDHQSINKPIVTSRLGYLVPSRLSHMNESLGKTDKITQDAFNRSSSTDQLIDESNLEQFYYLESPSYNSKLTLSHNGVKSPPYSSKQPLNHDGVFSNVYDIHDTNLNNKKLHEQNMDLQDEIQSLQGSLDISKEQKETLKDHIDQLKLSLSKKNKKCIEYQEVLHEKRKEIQQIAAKDSQERQDLQNEVDELRCREKELDNQIDDMDDHLNSQMWQIRDIEERFKKEKEHNREVIKLKDEEILVLHERIKKQTQSSQDSLDTIIDTYEKKLQESVDGRNQVLNDEVLHLQEMLKQAQIEGVKCRKQYELDCDRFRINMDALKSSNTKLKQEMDERNRKYQQEKEERVDHSSLSNSSNTENIQLKQQLIKTEKLFKTLTLEMIELNTALSVIMEKKDTPKRLSPSSRKISNGNVLLEAMLQLKENMNDVQRFIISLQQQQQQDSKINEHPIDDPTNSPTSAKLLRHLQSRMQQLRKENNALKEMTNINENTDEKFYVNKLQAKIRELEIALQNSEMTMQKNNQLLHKRSSEMNRLQRTLKQATKENMRLERSYASLQKSIGGELDTSNSKASVTLEDKSENNSLHGHTDEIPHVKSLGPKYPGNNILKSTVPKRYVLWSIDFPEYKPTDYTADVVKKQPQWADPEIKFCSNILKFNEIDELVDRRSHMGLYDVINGIPRNPMGRTGMTGRGLLGKWGPNHAVDPIVTRWSRDDEGNKIFKDGRPVLEFIAIRRIASGEWAFPGGIVDAGEAISDTLKREFSEEALNSLDIDNELRQDIRIRIEMLFKQGRLIYKGYVDDPRNTDNAWMETVVVNYHDNDGESVSKLPLCSGDDAIDVGWITIDKKLNLYASHIDFLKEACQLRGAYFKE